MEQRVAITKQGEEGVIEIDAKDGRVLTNSEALPSWAEWVVIAMLNERTGWYQQRTGATIILGEHESFEDFEWLGLDHNGDEVHIEADQEFRMAKLADMLGVDLMDIEDAKEFHGQIASAEAEHTYRSQPADEVTLREAERTTFEQVQEEERRRAAS